MESGNVSKVKHWFITASMLAFFMIFIIICYTLQSIISFIVQSNTIQNISDIILTVITFALFLAIIVLITLISIREKHRISIYLQSHFDKNRKKYKIFDFLVYGITILVISLFAILLIISPIKESKGNNELSVLYDQKYYSLPNPIIKYGLKAIFTPLSLVLKASGKSVALLPLSPDTLKYSVENSDYLFIWAHGGNDRIIVKSRNTALSYKLFSMMNKEKLKYVYISSCDIGINDTYENWVDAFYPAKLKIFTRNSLNVEHVIWILFYSYFYFK